ncbi:MAG: hypothetical protein N2246_08940 [Candidatus Sumerlaeia bacterium]|nr:hypothetical protein [Candidatus Sumerlaeia bacterium]
MREFIAIIIFLLIWILLVRVILPKFGIRTCCSGSSICSVEERPQKSAEQSKSETKNSAEASEYKE